MRGDFPLPVRVLRYMEQYPSIAFTEEAITKEFGCSIGRARQALRRLLDEELVLLACSVSRDIAYIVAHRDEARLTHIGSSPWQHAQAF